MKIVGHRARPDFREPRVQTLPHRPRTKERDAESLAKGHPQRTSPRPSLKHFYLPLKYLPDAASTSPMPFALFVLSP